MVSVGIWSALATFVGFMKGFIIILIGSLFIEADSIGGSWILSIKIPVYMV